MNNLRAAVVLFAIFGCGGSVSYADDRPNSSPVQTLFLDSHDGSLNGGSVIRTATALKCASIRIGQTDQFLAAKALLRQTSAVNFTPRINSL